MMMLRGIFFIGLLGLATAPAGAEEPPDDNIADQVVRQFMEDEGYQDVVHFEGIFSGISPAGTLKLVGGIQSERLRANDVRVLKITDTMPGVGPGLPEIVRYREVVILDIGDRVVPFMRDLPPEEGRRRELEAAGMSPELMAEGLRAYAAGAMMLGQALQDEVNNSPFGSMLSGMGAGDTDLADIDALAQGGAPCEDILRHASAAESIAATGSPDAIQPWTSLNPVMFMMGPACMALFAADVFDDIDNLSPAAKQALVDAFEDALAAIESAGVEEVDGRSTVRLRVDDLQLTAGLFRADGEFHAPGDSGGSPVADPHGGDSYGQVAAVYYYDEDEASAQQHRNPVPPRPQSIQFQAKPGQAGAPAMTINSVDLWIDAEYFVQRKMRLEGVMEENGEQREFFMEQLYQDYRNVPNSALYEPYKQVMRAGGVLSEAQRAELAEAEAQLEEFEEQMASMPASQRAMMENMMGDQVQQMRNLVNGGAVEFELITTDIEINPDYSNPMVEQFVQEMQGGSGSVDAGGNLVQRIQVDLTTLGYEPGNTDGVMDTMTQIAISQFEAEQGLPVTGEPGNAVAAALAAAVSRR